MAHKFLSEHSFWREGCVSLICSFHLVYGITNLLSHCQASCCFNSSILGVNFLSCEDLWLSTCTNGLFLIPFEVVCWHGSHQIIPLTSISVSSICIFTDALIFSILLGETQAEHYDPHVVNFHWELNVNVNINLMKIVTLINTFILLNETFIRTVKI